MAQDKTKDVYNVSQLIAVLIKSRNEAQREVQKTAALIEQIQREARND